MGQRAAAAAACCWVKCVGEGRRGWGWHSGVPVVAVRIAGAAVCVAHLVVRWRRQFGVARAAVVRIEAAVVVDIAARTTVTTRLPLIAKVARPLGKLSLAARCFAVRP